MKKIKWIILVLLLIIGVAVYLNYPKLNIISGYSAKNMCSSVFLAGRSAEFTDANDNNFGPINIAEDIVDKSTKSTTASVYSFKERKAIYREGLGSVLIPEGINSKPISLKPNREFTKDSLPFPYGFLPQKDTVFSTIDYKKLNIALDSAFAEKNKTRALLVLHKNQIVAEKYAEGFNKDSKFLGWSMTKSIVSTLYGVLEHQRKMDVQRRAPIDEWKNDERSAITIHNLLQMNSGLEWEENYATISDVTKMLFLESDMTKSQIHKPLVGKPNETWYYSSGTTNLLSGILRQQFKTHQDYLDFPYTNLIDKIGMHSMLIEADYSGNFVGSSYGWATARDWSKFGLLYLHNGNWNGEQIFKPSWRQYAVTPTNSSNGRYGAQIWLNAGGYLPDVPKDVFSFNGYQGQRVYMIPSHDMVIVRFGLDTMDFNELLSEILESFKEAN